MFFPRLENRVLEPEIMDDPEIDRERHFGALRGLARLNKISNSSANLWVPIKKLAIEQKLDTVRVLDIATGSGDIPIGLYKRARKQPFKLEIMGVDISPRALDFARERAAKHDAKVIFRSLNVLEDDFPEDFDVITASLFLHHLSNDQAEAFLERIAAATRKMILINDLLRNRRGLFLAHAAARMFTRSDVVRVDGPLSVKAAYTLAEMEAMVKSVGLTDVKLTKRWPCRFLLEWRRPW